MTEIFSSKAFQSFPSHQICGHALRVGGLVLVNSSDVRYTKKGTYFIGVYRLSKGKTITCKVGYVQVGWNEVGSEPHWMHWKIVPSPRSTDEHDRATKYPLHMKHHGYCVTNFVGGVGAVFAGKDVNRASLGLVQDDMEVTPDIEANHTGGAP